MALRRGVLRALASAPGLTLAPRMPAAQPAAAPLPRIGVLLPFGPGPSYGAFLQGLAELGHAEGRTLRIELRFASGQMDRLAALASELAMLRVDVIATVGAVGALPAKRVTADIPVVFAIVIDPVRAGLVADMERPGGNVTGATSFDPAQATAQMQLLRQTLPAMTRLAILWQAGLPDSSFVEAAQAAAEAEGLRSRVIALRAPAPDLDGAFAAIREERVDAVLGMEVPVVIAHGTRIAELAVAARLPLMLGRDYADHAPLLAYGTSLLAAARRMAQMVDRILKGARPADLPVASTTRHELIINIGVAQRIGVAIPPAVLARADQVIG